MKQIQSVALWTAALSRRFVLSPSPPALGHSAGGAMARARTSSTHGKTCARTLRYQSAKACRACACIAALYPSYVKCRRKPPISSHRLRMPLIVRKDELRIPLHKPADRFRAIPARFQGRRSRSSSCGGCETLTWAIRSQPDCKRGSAMSASLVESEQGGRRADAPFWPILGCVGMALDRADLTELTWFDELGRDSQWHSLTQTTTTA